MPERTADVRRLVELVHGLQQDQPRVAVVGHPGVWRDDLGELEDLLPMPGELRTRLKDWAARVDAADDAERRGERRRLARELQVALGPDFRVET